jgi:ribosomal protein L27
MLAGMKPKTQFHLPAVRYLLVILTSLFCVASACAQEGIVYAAFISEKDHYNSNGDRLTSVADILRQDRANFHKDGGDRADEDDGGIFATTEGRAKFEYYRIILQNLRARDLIRGSQGSIVVRVRGRRIYVEAVE